ncbi:hypothetical protein CYMTET_17057 [Cymbomonas tetramitiformis]|uniref:Uncharacterized protein n=1 Tax=Cymbomonas tetramitiformis TaxID=36881 RepID=A0AAE0L7J1_9CHLO|nr:hypothetical protein CYMTET_17057 [Cymbomonas tetramitiformis]
MGGERWMSDLVKGCVPTSVRQSSHQEEQRSALRYDRTRVNPLPLLALEHRLVRENRATDLKLSGEASRRQQLFDRLDDSGFYNKGTLDWHPLPEELASKISLKTLVQLVGKWYARWQRTHMGQGGAAGLTSAVTAATGDELDTKAASAQSAPRQDQGPGALRQ